MSEPSKRYAEQKDDYRTVVAPEAVEVGEDRLTFPGGVLLPLSARGAGVPGMPERPWSRLSADIFYSTGLPLLYSLALRREAPDTLRSSLRTRRTLFEGVMLALAEKTGRRPSLAEQATDGAMDAAESEIALGKPAFRAALLAGLFAHPARPEEAESARCVLESNLRARGLVPQRLFYIAERALDHFQPGGELFPGLDEPTLLIDEVLPLLPAPARRVMPAKDAVWVGLHARDGRDVHYSFTHGFDPAQPPPPHAITLILGEMGSGKTSLMRWVMLQRLLQGRTIISIDPEGENSRLCEALGGRVVPAGVPQDPDTCLIHPLQAEEPAEMLLAVRFLLASLAGEHALTPQIQAALHEAVQRRWQRRPGAMVANSATTSVAKRATTLALADLVDSLAAVNIPEAGVAIALLRPYARGGLWEGFFDRPKALLSPDFPPGQWWNFDLSALREENRAIVHAVLAWFLYHAVTIGKKPPALSAAEGMDIFIDEGWRLLRSGPFADLLDELGRRARKRGVGVTLITHLPADLARNPTSLSLASTAFIGRLGPEEAFAFFRSLGVSESEARRNAEIIANLPPRVFLAAPAGGRGALFPVLVTIPDSWLQMWNSLGAAR
jgi:hypothetical protein